MFCYVALDWTGPHIEFDIVHIKPNLGVFVIFCFYQRRRKCRGGVQMREPRPKPPYVSMNNN